MTKLVEQNPFRVLGVFSNASLKEITANRTRIAAYTKVGKTISFTLDAAGCNSAIHRSAEILSVVEHELSLPQTKIVNALFWFINGTSIDEIAIGHLAKGDIAKAKEILSKKETFSSLINLSVLGHCTGDLSLALNSMYLLVSNEGYCKAFVTAICGDTYTIAPFDLWKIYIDKLTSEKKASDLLKAFSTQYTGIERDYLKDKVIEKIVVTINKEIENSDEILKEQNPTRAYMAGIRLMDISKKGLPIVKRLVGEKDFRYINIADALAKQILQCGINYYNETDDDDDVDKAMVLQEYACSIAAGGLIAQRCRQNLEILKKKKEEGNVSDDIAYIIQALKNFQTQRKSIENARILVENCKPHLDIVSNQLGVTNELFTKMSSAVANNALGMIICVINDAQNNLSDIGDIGRNRLLTEVEEAVSVMEIISPLVMSPQERKRFEDNNSTLNNIKLKLLMAKIGVDETGTSWPPYHHIPTQEDNDGCFMSMLKELGGCLFKIVAYVVGMAIIAGILMLIAWIFD